MVRGRGAAPGPGQGLCAVDPLCRLARLPWTGAPSKRVRRGLRGGGGGARSARDRVLEQTVFAHLVEQRRAVDPERVRGLLAATAVLLERLEDERPLGPFERLLQRTAARLRRGCTRRRGFREAQVRGRDLRAAR